MGHGQPRRRAVAEHVDRPVLGIRARRRRGRRTSARAAATCSLGAPGPGRRQSTAVPADGRRHGDVALISRPSGQRDQQFVARARRRARRHLPTVKAITVPIAPPTRSGSATSSPTRTPSTSASPGPAGGADLRSSPSAASAVAVCRHPAAAAGGHRRHRHVRRGLGDRRAGRSNDVIAPARSSTSPSAAAVKFERRLVARPRRGIVGLWSASQAQAGAGGECSAR